MRYDDMVENLGQRLTTSTDNPGVVLAATVQALGEVGDHEEMSDLRSQLPGELSSVEPTQPGRDRSFDETVERVGELTGASDHDQARDYFEAGFAAVADAVSAGQLRQLMDTLGHDYQDLAPGSLGLSGGDETFTAQVRSNGKLTSNEQALYLSRVVLSLLSEHISEGQAGNLARQLPEALSNDLATRTAADHATGVDFLQQLRDRIRVPDEETAQRYLSAVIEVIDEWAPEELSDTRRQLPSNIGRLIAPS